MTIIYNTLSYELTRLIEDIVSVKSCENPLSKTEAMSFQDLDLVIDSGDRLNAFDS